MSNRVVLVTGASGFLGRQTLAPLAAHGFIVHAASRRPVAMAGVTWHALDLFAETPRRALLSQLRPTHLLHCAWTVEHGRFWTAPENADWVALSLCLAREAANTGVSRFVGVGSCAEYDWQDHPDHPRTEADPLRPATPYGFAKHATRTLSELMLAAAGVSFAWARMFHLYGPGEPEQKFHAALCRALDRGERFILRHGQLIRDLIRIDAAADALAALVAAETVSGAVNIGTGRGIALADHARSLATPRGLDHLLEVRSEPAPGEPPSMVADIRRLCHEVGWQRGELYA
ncbi:NAD-dependent epimerase/dehydratase family protein [Defluviicoccus vanus]|uniref:NAD-dependent epimerase/dehydratase family protein n=1 Tax=Defluviicoccus vanus TaxID=111831 RepID=A0A7H1N5D6_9PROT|nr:NAD-dependent epimerase/dehydratase family protein [Defluviicoccus vanus]QNT70922.1 NAD-dependent epimerase/dehydratase family protein [Defluviicoccus vanus]